MEKQDIFIAIGQALFAVFGSCVKWLNVKDRKRRNLFSLISEMVSAAFIGALIYCVYAWLGLNVYIAFCLAGIIGNQGAKGIDYIGRFIIKNSVFKDHKENEKR